jgi:hypothetical protein
MPLPPKTSDQELYDLCREIQQRDGTVTANRLRDAAGGGGYNRLKAIVEVWNERHAQETARSAKEATRDRQQREQAPPARADTPVPAEIDRSTLAHAEQEAIAAEEARVVEALAGGPAEPTEPQEVDEREPASLAEATRAVTDVLSAEPPAPSPVDTAETITRDEEHRPKPSIPVQSTVPSGEADRPSWSALQAENARLYAHLEDLRRENERLWAHVHEERTARIHEIELLNGLIASARRG